MNLLTSCITFPDFFQKIFLGGFVGVKALNFFCASALAQFAPNRKNLLKTE